MASSCSSCSSSFPSVSAGPVVLLIDFNCSTPGWSFSRDHHKKKERREGRKAMIPSRTTVALSQDIFPPSPSNLPAEATHQSNFSTVASASYLLHTEIYSTPVPFSTGYRDGKISSAIRPVSVSLPLFILTVGVYITNQREFQPIQLSHLPSRLPTAF